MIKKCLVVINVEECKGLSLEVIEFLVAGCIQTVRSPYLQASFDGIMPLETVKQGNF